MPLPAEKRAAFEFLQSLEEHLNLHLPGPRHLIEEISTIISQSRKSGDSPQTNFAEGALLNQFVIPHLHDFLVKGLGHDGAKAALLSESFRSLPSFASGTPARSKRHPFSKVIGIQPAAAMRQWRQPSAKALVRSCPDLALRPPSQHKIVFEAKYFPRGGAAAAGTALATGIYQAFFYRGLPLVPTDQGQRSWDYDYACLLAYDATAEGSLQKAWNSIHEEVRREGFWGGANIYVMILRGRWLPPGSRRPDIENR